MGLWSGPPLSSALVLAVRYSMAKCTPWSLRLSTVRSRGCVAPVQTTMASKSLRSSIGSTFSPTLALQTNLTPSCSMSSMRRSTTSFLSSFMLGMPYMSRPPGPVGALEDRDRVAGAVELRGGGEAGRAGADHGDLLAGARRRRLGRDPALLPAAVDDGVLDALDGHRRGVDAEHARALAGRRADAAGELREVVGLVQALERLAPEAAVDEVVPLRDQVVDRAARGHAAR